MEDIWGKIVPDTLRGASSRPPEVSDFGDFSACSFSPVDSVESLW